MGDRINNFIRLNNEKSTASKFRTNRNMENAGTSRDSAKKVISITQKEIYSRNLKDFLNESEARKSRKNMLKKEDIDYISISFFDVFTNDLTNKFYSKYGLEVRKQEHFNTSVLFQVIDKELFNNFILHLIEIIDSPINTSYFQKGYNLLATIRHFEFYTSQDRFNLTDPSEATMYIDVSGSSQNSIQFDVLMDYLGSNDLVKSISSQDSFIITTKRLPKEIAKFLVDNFDIILTLSTTRALRIRPNIEGPLRDYGFTTVVDDDLPIVGVIDSGIEAIDPLSALIVGGIDITDTMFQWDEEGHGTSVAGIVAFGDEFYTNPGQSRYYAKAKLFALKALHNSNDALDINKIIAAIKRAITEFDIKLFNLSLNIDYYKKYNEAHSLFAFELDKVTHEEDVLIFISAGNFNETTLISILSQNDPANHSYPYFFYNPNSTSSVHVCEDTNLFPPAESMNNISVGALAGNLDQTNDNSDLSPVKEYPSYYTRKFHYDPIQAESNYGVKMKLKHFSKPDFIFDGGDYANENSAFELLANKQKGGYVKSSGTSISTPFITSYAAEIVRKYPSIRLQTVKALLINSTNGNKASKYPDFLGNNEHILKKLFGFGTPNKADLFQSANNTIIYIIEDDITCMEMKKIPIMLPNRLRKSGNKLQFDVSMAFSFRPNFEDQSNYLPFSISFGLFKNVSIDNLSTGVVTKQKDTKEGTPIYGIKNKISWSEDFFGFDKLIPSNAQRMTYRLQPTDFEKVNDEVAIVFRCFAKQKFRQTNPTFRNQLSIVVKITELCDNENNSTLYNEMIGLNNYLDLNLDLDANLSI